MDYARRLNREHLENGGDPTEMPVIFTKHVKKTQGAFFFDAKPGHAMAGFLGEVRPVVKQRADREINERLADIQNIHVTSNFTL